MRLFSTAAVLAAGTLISGCAAMGMGGDAAPSIPAGRHPSLVGKEER